MSDTENYLVLYDNMCSAIALCYQIDEAAMLRNKAITIQELGKRTKNKEIERQFREVRLRLERRIGELLKEQDKAKGAQGDISLHLSGGRATRRPEDRNEVTLAKMGLTRDQSSQYQRIASIPTAEFEVEVKKPTASTASLVNHTKAKQQPKSEDKKPNESTVINFDIDSALSERVRRYVHDYVLPLYEEKLRQAELLLNYKKPFSNEEFRRLLSVLHPDNMNYEMRNEMFVMCKQREILLRQMEPGFKLSGTLPTTLEELMKRRKNPK